MAQTYGEHQEEAAAALTRLVVSDTLPTDQSDIDRMLVCREVVIDALRQRLYGLGLTGHYSPGLIPATPRRLSLIGIEQHLPTLVDRIVFDFPTLPVGQRSPATEALTHAGSDPTVDLWQQVAVALLAGSHALDTAPDRPWLRDQGAGWYLMRDIAVALEAVIVLDSRLAEVGLLQDHEWPDTALDLAERRMIASQCARVAGWHATSDSPDGATADTPQPRAVVGPVVTVTAPAHLADAQRRLANYLRPSHGNEVFFTGEPETDASTARMVVSSQLFLLEEFEQLAIKVPGSGSIRADFANRREVLAELQPNMKRLVDAEDRGRNLRASWQQGELTTALHRLQRSGRLQLTTSQLHELANASHEVTNNLGKALRRELLRDHSNLRLADPTGQVGPTRVYRKHPFERTLTDLVNIPAPTAPVARYSSPLQRAALQRTLDLTPTGRRPPSPYPRARGQVSSPTF